MKGIKGAAALCLILSIGSMFVWDRREVLPEAVQREFTGQEKAAALEAPEEEDKIPWGFDAYSYQLYREGAFDSFIQDGWSVDQCVSGDLDLDGIEDVILSVMINYEENDYGYMHFAEINTMILRGLGNDRFELAAENEKINYYVTYDGSAKIECGAGWFKFTRARGTAGGYEHNYYFEYNPVQKDWFFTEYYSNNGGYIFSGTAKLKTPASFGEVSFSRYPFRWLEHYLGQYNAFSINTEMVKLEVYMGILAVHLQDQEKAERINRLIQEDVEYVAQKLLDLQIPLTISIYSGTTFQSPEVISIVYNISEPYNEQNPIGSGFNGRNFTTVIDMEQEKRISLAEMINIDALIDTIYAKGFAHEYDYNPTEAAEEQFLALDRNELFQLLMAADDLDTVLQDGGQGMFSAVYELSLCLYFPSDNMEEDGTVKSVVSKLYVHKEDILPYVNVDFWDRESKAASRIIWKG